MNQESGSKMDFGLGEVNLDLPHWVLSSLDPKCPSHMIHIESYPGLNHPYWQIIQGDPILSSVPGPQTEVNSLEQVYGDF